MNEEQTGVCQSPSEAGARLQTLTRKAKRLPAQASGCLGVKGQTLGAGCLG